MSNAWSFCLIVGSAETVSDPNSVVQICRWRQTGKGPDLDSAVGCCNNHYCCFENDFNMNILSDILKIHGFPWMPSNSILTWKTCNTWIHSLIFCPSYHTKTAPQLPDTQNPKVDWAGYQLNTYSTWASYFFFFLSRVECLLSERKTLQSFFL